MADINRIIKEARNTLVGKVPDPQSQIDQITLALIYKFMDAKDKEAVALGLQPQFFVGEYADYSFSNIMSAPSNPKQFELYTKGIDLLQKRIDLPETFVSVFKDAFVPYRDAQTLHLFLNEIDKIPTDNTELLGTAFEDLLSIMGSQGDAGQFRTPRHIIDMIVEIVEPKTGESILDPACGTAGFLISAYKKINKQDLTIEERDKLINEGLVGYDINPNMVKLASVNLFLHGCKKPNIHLYDTLTEKDFWKDNYDVILANPPFMTPKGGIRPHELFSAINANRSEVLFTYYIAKHLRRDGRAGIIVPEGVVFQSANAYKNLRKMLVEENYLYAVISLPAGVFNPYSGVKTSVLLFDKALARKTDEMLFVKMNNDGFDLGAQRRPIDKNDIPAIVDTVKRFISCVATATESDFVDEIGVSSVVSKSRIAENDYILVGDRYKEKHIRNSCYEFHRLDEILLKVRYDTKIPKSEYKSAGKIPIIDQSENFIAGYTDDQNSLYHFDKAVICFGDHTRVLKYIDFDFALGADGVKILLPNEKVSTKYLYYILQSDPVEGRGYSRHYSYLKEKTIPLPPLEIQEQIVAELDSYQKIVDGARQIVENYKPTINVDPNWDVVKLGEVCELNPQKKEVKEFQGDVSFVPMAILNENDMRFYPEEQRHIGDVYSGYTFFKDGDVLLAKVTPCFENGKSGLAEGLINGIGFGSSEFYVLRANTEKIMPQFIYYVVHSRDFITRGKSNMTGTGGLQRLTKEFVLSYTILLPSLEKQQQIVENINEEMAIIEQNKRLIEIFEQKINAKINEVWGSEIK